MKKRIAHWSAVDRKTPPALETRRARGMMDAGKALQGVEGLEGFRRADDNQADSDGVQTRGKARPGDGTAPNGLRPDVEAMKTSPDDLRHASSPAEKAADDAFRAGRGRAARQGNPRGEPAPADTPRWAAALPEKAFCES